jgi:hypothetical protein
MQDKKSIFSSISSGLDSSKTNESASSPRLDEIEKKIKIIDEKLSKVVSQKEEELKYREEILDKLKRIEEKKEPDSAAQNVLIKEIKGNFENIKKILEELKLSLVSSENKHSYESLAKKIASEVSATKVETNKEISTLEIGVSEIKQLLIDYYKKYDDQTKAYVKSLEKKDEINKNLKNEISFLKNELLNISAELKKNWEKFENSNENNLSIISKKEDEFDIKLEEIGSRQEKFLKSIEETLKELKETQINYEKQMKDLLELEKENEASKNIKEGIKVLKEDLSAISSDLKGLLEKVEISNKDNLAIIYKQGEEFNLKLKELKEIQINYGKDIKDISKILVSLSELKTFIKEMNNPIISKLEENLSENKKNSEELALISTDIIQAISTKLEKITTILSEMPQKLEEKSLDIFLKKTDQEYYADELREHYEYIVRSAKVTILILKEVIDDFNKFNLTPFSGVSGELIKRNLIKLDSAYSEFKASLEENEDISKGI